MRSKKSKKWIVDKVIKPLRLWLLNINYRWTR